MIWNGKIIGVFIGAFFGGIFGAVIGLTIGHLFDSGAIHRWLGLTPQHRHSHQTGHVQHVFFTTSFSIMGYLAKSDGRVSEREIQTARHVMTELNLNDAMRQEAIAYFNLGKQADFSVAHALGELKRACWRHPSLLRTFIDIQVRMAYADGQHISQKKQAAFETICHHLGIRGASFHHFNQRYRSGQQSHQQHRQYRPRQQQTEDPYTVLGVDRSSNAAEIKKAYRRQMSKNHPDKLIAKGLPPEMIKLATQKTQKIQDAYETIKKQRGFS